jgi:ParB family transcriptional regulator, chromosome partitioning protein
MKNIMEVSAFRCRVWDKHERLEEYVTEDSCRDEIASVTTHGQIIPALGRPVRGDPKHDYEIICGTRRLFIARHLNLPLLLEVRQLSDQEAVASIEIENRLRRNLSPYERGKTYTQWLRARIYRSQEELARAVMISPAQVCRLIKLAQLPSVIVSAFETPMAICETWGASLLDAWNDPIRHELILARARAIAREGKRPDAEVVYARLLAASGCIPRCASRSLGVSRDDVVKDDRGQALFRIKYHRHAIAFVLTSDSVSPGIMNEIRAALSVILQNGIVQMHEFSREVSRTASRATMTRTAVAYEAR